VQREEENLIYYQRVMTMELTSEAYMDESSGMGFLDNPLKIWSYASCPHNLIIILHVVSI
jgi:hypothetical protein